MKAVMLSIQPKWCELIASGKKTIEVRKTAPKLQTPFKCYIYCTQGDGSLNDTLMSANRCHVLNGKVIGEFVCDKIELLPESIIKTDCYDLSIDTKCIVAESCLTREEVSRYMGDNVLLYGWHISDLKIYDTPKELWEFYSTAYQKKCKPCDALCEYYPDCALKKNRKPLTRPFQNWGYIEELSE